MRVHTTVCSRSVKRSPQVDWLPPEIFLKITAGLRPRSLKLFVGSTPSSCKNVQSVGNLFSKSQDRAQLFDAIPSPEATIVRASLMFSMWVLSFTCSSLRLSICCLNCFHNPNIKSNSPHKILPKALSAPPRSFILLKSRSMCAKHACFLP